MLHRNRSAPANGVTGGGGVKISNLCLGLAASLCLHPTFRRFDDLMDGGDIGDNTQNLGILRVIQNSLNTFRLIRRKYQY